MALICPHCKARNRSVAKFCIECITSLPTGCADTDFAPTMLAASKASYLGLPSAFRAKRPKAAAPSQAEVVAAAAPMAKGVWISIAGLVTALIIGSAGWLVLGAGGWYLYTAGSAQVDPPRPQPASVAATNPVEEKSEPPAEPVSPEHNHPPVEVVAAPTQESPAAAPAEAEAPVAALATSVRRKAAAAKASAASAPARELAMSKTQEAALPQADDAASKPHAVLEPATACASLNFIAAARCMAAQCLKREFKSHPQCEVVRRRQRLEEEKRNPPAP